MIFTFFLLLTFITYVLSNLLQSSNLNTSPSFLPPDAYEEILSNLSSYNLDQIISNKSPSILDYYFKNFTQVFSSSLNEINKNEDQFINYNYVKLILNFYSNNKINNQNIIKKKKSKDSIKKLTNVQDYSYFSYYEEFLINHIPFYVSSKSSSSSSSSLFSLSTFNLLNNEKKLLQYSNKDYLENQYQNNLYNINIYHFFSDEKILPPFLSYNFLRYFDFLSLKNDEKLFEENNNENSFPLLNFNPSEFLPHDSSITNEENSKKLTEKMTEFTSLSNYYRNYNYIPSHFLYSECYLHPCTVTFNGKTSTEKNEEEGNENLFQCSSKSSILIWGVSSSDILFKIYNKKDIDEYLDVQLDLKYNQLRKSFNSFVNIKKKTMKNKSSDSSYQELKFDSIFSTSPSNFLYIPPDSAFSTSIQSNNLNEILHFDYLCLVDGPSYQNFMSYLNDYSHLSKDHNDVLREINQNTKSLPPFNYISRIVNNNLTLKEYYFNQKFTTTSVKQTELDTTETNSSTNLETIANEKVNKNNRRNRKKTQVVDIKKVDTFGSLVKQYYLPSLSNFNNIIDLIHSDKNYLMLHIRQDNFLPTPEHNYFNKYDNNYGYMIETCSLGSPESTSSYNYFDNYFYDYSSKTLGLSSDNKNCQLTQVLTSDLDNFISFHKILTNYSDHNSVLYKSSLLNYLEQSYELISNDGSYQKKNSIGLLQDSNLSIINKHNLKNNHVLILKGLDINSIYQLKIASTYNNHTSYFTEFSLPFKTLMPTTPKSPIGIALPYSTSETLASPLVQGNITATIALKNPELIGSSYYLQLNFLTVLKNYFFYQSFIKNFNTDILDNLFNETSTTPLINSNKEYNNPLSLNKFILPTKIFKNNENEFCIKLDFQSSYDSGGSELLGMNAYLFYKNYKEKEVDLSSSDKIKGERKFKNLISNYMKYSLLDYKLEENSINICGNLNINFSYFILLKTENKFGEDEFFVNSQSNNYFITPLFKILLNQTSEYYSLEKKPEIQKSEPQTKNYYNKRNNPKKKVEEVVEHITEAKKSIINYENFHFSNYFTGTQPFCDSKLTFNIKSSNFYGNFIIQSMNNEKRLKFNQYKLKKLFFTPINIELNNKSITKLIIQKNHPLSSIIDDENKKIIDNSTLYPRKNLNIHHNTISIWQSFFNHPCQSSVIAPIYIDKKLRLKNYFQSNSNLNTIPQFYNNYINGSIVFVPRTGETFPSIISRYQNKGALAVVIVDYLTDKDKELLTFDENYDLDLTYNHYQSIYKDFEEEMNLYEGDLINKSLILSNLQDITNNYIKKHSLFSMNSGNSWANSHCNHYDQFCLLGSDPSYGFGTQDDPNKWKNIKIPSYFILSDLYVKFLLDSLKFSIENSIEDNQIIQKRQPHDEF